MTLHHFALAGLAAGALGAASHAQSTIHVATCGDDSWSGLSDVCQAPDGPKATIQGAIDVAAPGDTVLLLPGNYTGAGNRDLDLLGKAIQLRSRDGADATVVDLQGLAGFAVVRPAGDQVTLIEGLTVVNGSTESRSLIQNHQQHAPLVIRDCVFADNEHYGYDFPTGGVISVYGSDVTLEGCQFLRNDFYLDGPEVAYSSGGAIYVLNADLSVADCVFEDTYATHGGGIAFEGYPDEGPDRLLVERSVFRNLRGTLGAGLFARDAESVRVLDCVFESNRAYDFGDSNGSASARGGGAYIVANHLELARCDLRSNSCEVDTGPDRSARGGGAYLVSAQSAQITDCLFAGNNADDFDHEGAQGTGGGVYLWLGTGASAHVTGCTSAGNTAGLAGGGMTVHFSHASAGAQIDNSIVHGNAGGAISVEQAGTLVVSYSDVEGGYPGDGNIDADPLFVDPANGDYRLGAGSPGIDAADNTAVPLGYPLDLAGEPRFRDDPTTPDTGVGIVRVVDMGAYEYQPGPFCAADFNDDGARNTQDVLAFLNAWNAGEPTADANADGTLNTQDVLAFLNQWNAGC